MTEHELLGIWHYYLSLEKDLSNTSRYVEPLGQENVFSFEFAKLIVLSCTEIESVFKQICSLITGEKVVGDIGTYKATILGKYPRIIESTVLVSRLRKSLSPFASWAGGKLEWWSAYQRVKHNRGAFFSEATYSNAVNAIGALYISIFYLAETAKIEFPSQESEYIISNYSPQFFLVAPPRNLPDFEV